MKKVFCYCILPILYICFISLLIIFRIQFVASTWEGYRILAVPVSVSEKKVLNELESQGITDVISFSSVSMCPKNELTPVTSFEMSYRESIKNYFLFERIWKSRFKIKPNNKKNRLNLARRANLVFCCSDSDFSVRLYGCIFHLK